MVKAAHKHLQLLLMLLCSACLAQQQLQPPFQKTIWVYAEQPNHMAQLEKLSLSNIRHYAEKSKYELILLTRQNISLFLNISETTRQLEGSRFLSSSILERGLIQLSLLNKKGGIWIDLPTMLTETLEWMATLNNQKHINNRIEDPNVIMFYTPQWLESTHKRSLGKIQDLVVHPMYQTWFLGATKDSQFIQDCIKLYLQIIKKSHTQFNSFCSQYDLNPQQFLLNPDEFLPWVVSSAISIKQAKFDRQYGTASSRRLAIAYYKISGINSQKTAYLLSAEAKHHTHLTAKYFAEVPVGELSLHLCYMLRMTPKVAEEIEPMVDSNIILFDHMHSSVKMVCQGASVPYQHVADQSVVDKFLLAFSPSQQVNTYSSSFIAKCSITYGAVLYELFIRYLLPFLGFILHLYVVRRMILIFKPEWGVRRRRTP